MKKLNWKTSTLALAFGFLAPALHAEGFNAIGNSMETMRSSDLDFELVVREDDRRRPVRNAWTCTAQDRYGLSYSATDTNRFEAREAAMDRCERRSYRCYDAGCRPIR